MMRTATVAIALLLISAVVRAAPVPVTIVALVPFQCSMTATTVVNGFVVRSTFTRDDLGCVEIGPPSNSAAHFGPLPPVLSEITRALLLLALSATGFWILASRSGIR